MISSSLSHLLRLLSLLLLQIFVLNNVELPGIFNPYVYVYFILLLPLGMPRWQLLFVSFGCGLLVDVFTHSLGMHAFACTLLGFLRPYATGAVQPAGGYDPEDRPTLGSMGFRWFLSYSLPLVFLHHLVLFVIETLSVRQLGFVILKVGVSALIAETIILLFEFFFSRRKRA